MADTICEVKFEKVWDILLQNDKTRDSALFSTLLWHLTRKTVHSNNELLVNSIVKATFHFKNPQNKPTQDIFTFILNITSLISKDEFVFFKLNTQNVYETLFKVMDFSNDNSVKMAFVNVMTSFLEHKSGLQWIIAMDYWANILLLTVDRQTSELSEMGEQFIGKLLKKVIAINENFCDNVVQLLIQPICDAAVYFREDSSEFDENFINTVLAISGVLDSLIFEKFPTLDLFVTHFDLRKMILKFMTGRRAENVCYKLSEILVKLAFCKFATNHEKLKSAERFIEDLMEIYAIQIQKGYVQCLMQLNYISTCLYAKLPEEIKRSANKGNVNVEKTIMMFSIVPVGATFAQIVGRQFYINCQIDDNREQYLVFLFQQLTEKTVTTGYQYRNIVSASPFLYENAALSIKYLLKAKPYTNRSMASVIFELLAYCFKDLVEHLFTNGEILYEQILTKGHNFIEMMLDFVGVLLGDYNLCWKDSVETLNIMNSAFQFLSFAEWTPKLVVKGLKLIEISISKYASPNLALLLDSQNDTTLKSLVPLLNKKLQGNNCDIMKSTLDVVYTLCFNANSRFPSFQEIISKGNFPRLVWKLATEVTESPVKAAALRCLQEMVQARSLWDNLAAINELQEKLIQLIEIESDHSVRKETVILVNNIQKHRNFPQSLLLKLYDTMYLAATSDFHSEVKINALRYWKIVIDIHLQNQDMVDGAFPDVTFSKEQRKIVTLDTAQIQKRLAKVLRQLSDIGCLSVFVVAFKDADNEVAMTATMITNEFLTLLRKYNVNETSNLTVETCGSVKTPSSVLNNTERGRNCTISPEEFLNVVYNNQDAFCSNKRKRSNTGEDFELFLDSVLNKYRYNFEMDCSQVILCD